MSEIHANIVVQPFGINVTLDQPGITVTPNVTSLNIYAVGGTNGVPAGNVGDLQYYAANGFAAIPSNVANYTSGNLKLNVGNLNITGGNNGYFLQTDGNGNINWAAGGGGIGSPGGSNTQIQYNDSGTFGGSTGFTFNKTSNVVGMPGNLSVAGIIDGNGSGLNSIAAANIVGTVANASYAANANYASFAGSTTSAATASTVTANAQPNINSVGNLSGLQINGVLNAGVIKTSQNKIALGLDAGLTLQDIGAVALGISAGFYAQGANAVAISYEAGRDTQGANSIAIGINSGRSFQGANSIAIGVNAGSNGQAGNSIAIGTNAAPNVQPTNTIVINATGSNLNALTANSLFVKPIRDTVSPSLLYYNGTTGEVTYSLPSFSELTVSGNTSITGTLSIQQAKEKVTVSSSPATGTVNYDILTSAIVLNTANATANFTLNFRGNGLATLNDVMLSNQSMTCSFINTNGATAYVPTQLQIDGANIIPLWSGTTASPVPGTPVGKDMYIFNIVKTASNTFTVLASRTGFA